MQFIMENIVADKMAKTHIDMHSYLGGHKAAIDGHVNDILDHQIQAEADKIAAKVGLPSVDEIGELIKKMTVHTEETDKIPVHCALAASYGKLNSDTIKAMDDHLQIMIAGTVKKLNKNMKMMPKYPSWEQVKSMFESNVLIEKVPSSEVTVHKEYGFSHDNVFKTDGSASTATINEVMNWYEHELMTDGDIRADVKLDIDAMANIVAQTGASVNSFETFFAKDEFHKKTVMEIGVLRFPDIDHPYFKVYRVQLVATSHCFRILFVQHDDNGINGTVQSIKYRPRKSVMDSISAEIKAKAKKEAEDIFS